MVCLAFCVYFLRKIYHEKIFWKSSKCRIRNILGIVVLRFYLACQQLLSSTSITESCHSKDNVWLLRYSNPIMWVKVQTQLNMLWVPEYN